MTMPRKRNTENRGLPARWVQKHGAFYYLPPPDLRVQWGGKAWFRLGSTMAEAYQVWAERVGRPTEITTIGALLDRYLLEVVPTKAARTQAGNKAQIRELRRVFDSTAIGEIEPHHIYQYHEARTAKRAAELEIETLRHALTKAVQWGLLKRHPFKGEVRIARARNTSGKRKSRYVEDWEILEMLALPPATGVAGCSTRMLQAYVRIKLLTGIRQTDMLMMAVDWLKDEGIRFRPHKTINSTEQEMIFEWSPLLREAVDAAIAARPALSPYLFCDDRGAPLIDIETTTAKKFQERWQRFVKRLVAETKIEKPMTERSLRCKAGSDEASIARAQELLGHADARTTRTFYRLAPNRVKPAG